MSLIVEGQQLPPQNLTPLQRGGRFVLVHYRAEQLADDLRKDFLGLKIVSISEDSHNNDFNVGEGALVRPDGVMVWVGRQSMQARERLGELRCCNMAARNLRRKVTVFPSRLEKSPPARRTRRAGVFLIMSRRLESSPHRGRLGLITHHGSPARLTAQP
ncbi:hypothetical protein ACQ9Y2_10055 [Pseudomonas palleroniana]